MIFCIHEDRLSGEVGLRILIGSLRLHRPGCRVWIFYATPSDDFRRWLAGFADCELKAVASHHLRGWNSKPGLLEECLAAGHREVVWLDSDILVRRDPWPFFAGLRDEALVVAREPLNQPGQGTVWRARAWGLSPGRETGFTLNTCVVRVTDCHRSLLREWDALLRRPDYVAQQALPFAERRWEMRGDQDALGALLGSAPAAGVALQVLGTGRQVIHSGGLLMYGLRERLAGLFAAPPLFIHALADKPWIEPAQPGSRLARLIALTREVSPYVARARLLREAAGLENAGWLTRRTFWGRVFSLAGLGHDAFRGLPLTLGFVLARRLLRPAADPAASTPVTARNLPLLDA